METNLAEPPVVTALVGPVLHVWLNRPEVHNAFNGTLIEGLTAVFANLAAQEEVRAVVLSGRGRSFCAGGDLDDMRAAAGLDFSQNLAGAQAIFDLMQAVDTCPRPVIGRINGAAIGGGAGLVSCCDIVVAAERAVFGFSEVRLGIVPAVISPFVLRKIGASQARRLFLTGERVDAAYAQQIGLVHDVASEETLDERVATFVEQLLAGAPGAQAAAKVLIRAIDGRDPAALRDSTSTLIAERRASAEGQEGLSAFLEKRQPSWHNAQSESKKEDQS